MKICVIGTGYVGLVSGACFADLGNAVLCVDQDENKIAMLNNKQIPIYEPGLDYLVEKNYSSGRLKFSTDINLAIKKSDIIFICVGTPTDKKTGSADIKNVFNCGLNLFTRITLKIMITFHIFFIAIIQGITEFLPISSSAHLIILPYLMKFSEKCVIIDISAHLGSLLALIIFFKKDSTDLFSGLIQFFFFKKRKKEFYL